MKILFTLALALFTLPVLSQTNQDQEYYEGGLLDHLNVSAGISTMGLGIEAATPINSNFKLRLGMNYMGYTSKGFDISLNDDNGALKDAVGYVPDYKMDAKMNFTNAHLLVDYHPFKKGIFHLTGGFYIGKNKLKAQGQLLDSNGDRSTLLPEKDWPTLDFDGNVISIDDGNLDATLELGKVIKPYVGLGLGRAISKGRVSFKFELGAIYQGSYTLKQNGKKVDLTGDTVSENFEDIDNVTKWLKWWPMLNFQLTYKIF